MAGAKAYAAKLATSPMATVGFRQLSSRSLLDVIAAIRTCSDSTPPYRTFEI